MHDGSVPNLTEVVKLYVKGGIPNPNLDRKVDQRYAEILDLNERQIKQLVAFMEARGWEPFAFQREVWERHLRGGSGLVHVPTGAGKTRVRRDAP